MKGLIHQMKSINLFTKEKFYCKKCNELLFIFYPKRKYLKYIQKPIVACTAFDIYRYISFKQQQVCRHCDNFNEYNIFYHNGKELTSEEYEKVKETGFKRELKIFGLRRLKKWREVKKYNKETVIKTNLKQGKKEVDKPIY